MSIQLQLSHDNTATLEFFKEEFNDLYRRIGDLALLPNLDDVAQSELQEIFNETVDFIEEARKEGKKPSPKQENITVGAEINKMQDAIISLFKRVTIHLSFQFPREFNLCKTYRDNLPTP